MYKIGVSGSAANNCAPGAYAKSREIGRQIALAKAICVTGHTNGIPHAAIHGAKAGHGLTVGISPAASETDHLKKYHLPKDELDIIIYTGFQYSGRDILFVRACDAMIFICGRLGTLNEFAISYEDKKPIGILTQSGGISDEIDHILEVSHRGDNHMIFDNDPKRLVEKVLEELNNKEKLRKKLAKAHLLLKGKRS